MKTALIPLFLALVTITARASELHVATNGNDANAGARDTPLRTIQHAADLAQPGDVITVHSGVYRERITPPRGGTSDDKRIVYQAAPGETVEIKGSEPIKGWTRLQENVWQVRLPNSFFGAFNPFADLIRGDWFTPKGREHHTGAVYLNGDWLIEAATLDEVLGKPHATSSAKPTPAKKEYLINLTWLQTGDPSKRTLFTEANGNHELKKAPCSEGGECVGWIEPGDWIRCADLQFDRPTDTLQLRASCASAGATIEVRRDSPTGELLGTYAMANSGGWQSWTTCKVRVKSLQGRQTLCFVFQRGGPVAPPAPLWFAKVDPDHTTIWAQFKDIDPNKQSVEINKRRTVFYPDQPGRNFITVRGFTMLNAATPWAPPTAEQIGLIGTHWSKGWIIENNIISHSICSGIALGKHGDQFDNTSANTAEGYVKTIERAHAFKIPWTKEDIGHHVVRHNTISHCEQTGIVGSLGCAFSTVTDNVIHDIHIRRLFTGAEMAGIKFHGAIDAVIEHNKISRCGNFAIWLDWMAQGTRVTRNLLHDNVAPDLFVEVNHGPFIVDHNLFLSPRSLLVNSQGGAYAHNLMAGTVSVIHTEKRQTPSHPPHSTTVAALPNNPSGDDRYFNNLMVQRTNLTVYDKALLPVFMSGNVFVAGALPSKHEATPLISPNIAPDTRLDERADGCYLTFPFDQGWTAQHPRKLVNSELLGITKQSNLPYETAEGTPISIDHDYLGTTRDRSNPTPGPFEKPGIGPVILKVW